jgi:hypothetical protein
MFGFGAKPESGPGDGATSDPPADFRAERERAIVALRAALAAVVDADEAAQLVAAESGHPEGHTEIQAAIAELTNRIRLIENGPDQDAETRRITTSLQRIAEAREADAKMASEHRRKIAEFRGREAEETSRVLGRRDKR